MRKKKLLPLRGKKTKYFTLFGDKQFFVGTVTTNQTGFLQSEQK